MNYKLIIGVVVGLILVGGGFSLVSSMMAKNAPTSSAVVIAEKDFLKREAEEAGTTRTDTRNVTPPKPEESEEPLEIEEEAEEIIPVADEETPEEGIRKAFMDKYGKPESEVSVTITQSTENHAKGGVKFGEGGVGEGGLFLATKINGVWTLVFDGNGSIACADLAPYGFPPDMIGEICF